MKILYKNSTAEKQFCSKYKKKWSYPEAVKIKLAAIENFLESASSLMDVFNYRPYHFHQLQGNRKGEWSIYVGNTGYRVHLIPCDENEEPIMEGDVLSKCKYIKIVMVTEVSNHYE